MVVLIHSFHSLICSIRKEKGRGLEFDRAECVCYSTIMPTTTVTIPKEFTRGEDLIIIPQKEYREFLRWQKNTDSTPRQIRIAKATAIEIKDFKQAQSDYQLGKVINFHELKRRLGTKN